jgi:diguanylate cyclase (GGDEF)-like protein
MLRDVKLLYIEDDEYILEEIVYFLQPRVKELLIAKNGQEGYELYKKHSPDIVVTDVQMPKLNGLDLCEKIRKENKDIPIVVASAYNDNDFLLRSIQLEINGYITKPIDLKDLINVIEKSYEKQKLKKDLEETTKKLIKINKDLDKIVKEKTQDLEYLYRHDKLTSLKNSIALQKDIDSNKYDYLLLLDIAHFSYINKQYGKKFGSDVLKATAQNLLKHSNPNLNLYKIESDKFVFLTKNMSKEDIEDFCNQIHSYFDTQKIGIDDISISISFYIGIASFDIDEDIFIQAEYAVDTAKSLGGRFCSFYDKKDTTVLKNRNMIKWLSITLDLIENDKLIPYYQPVYDLKKEEIVYYEVLARAAINDDIILPINFIEPAVELGLISSITKMMIKKSFEHFKNNDYSFSINISQRDLYEDFLFDYLKEKSKEYNINPSRVTLEILENITIESHHNIIIEQLNKLNDYGFKIAIDDFGTKNSNFSRLMHIHFDYIKLDSTFILNIDKSKKKQLIVESIVKLAKNLNKKVIAEYVESEEANEVVKNCGVDYVQGYYYAKPQKTTIDVKDLRKKND